MSRVIGVRFDTNEQVEVLFAEGRITSVRELPGDPQAATAARQTFLAPGLVDLQVNGCERSEFVSSNLDVEQVLAIGAAQIRFGVTRFCPTVTTNSFARLAASLTILAQATDQSRQFRRICAGFHVEGPYISAQDGPRGAHPLEHCRPPDWNEFCRLQQAANGQIRLLTLSPEYPGADEFIRQTVGSGVRVAIGHTAANSDQIKRAVDAGASLSTHLGNGAHGQIRRHPNYLWDQLAEDRLIASLIADGHHLPPAVIKSFVRCKTPERVILVSDVTGMAGMPAGRYASDSLGEVEVMDDGRLVVAGQTQYLAGASRPLIDGLANVVNFAEVDLAEAVRMASSRPADFIGCSVNQFRVGDPADFIELSVEESANGDLTCELKQTWEAGRPVSPHDSLGRKI